MKQYDAHVSFLLRQYAVQAFEREIAPALNDLSASFDRFANKDLTTSELVHRIHRFEVGISASLTAKYNGPNADFIVASAIVEGVLAESDVEADVLKQIIDIIDFIRDRMA